MRLDSRNTTMASLLADVASGKLTRRQAVQVALATGIALPGLGAACLHQVLVAEIVGIAVLGIAAERVPRIPAQPAQELLARVLDPLSPGLLDVLVAQVAREVARRRAQDHPRSC